MGASMGASAVAPASGCLPAAGVQPAGRQVAGADTALLRCVGVTRRYGAHVAVKAVDLEIRPGEVHVLFGENGAGKSSLIGMISRVAPVDGGELRFDGRDIGGLDASAARAAGIAAVFQEFSLVPALSVAENLFLGREWSRRGLRATAAMRERARQVVAELGFDLDVDAKVGRLSRAHQQMTEICKALMGEVRLLILDEPTASLTERESERLFELIGRLKAEGVGIIYVSHRMREIRALADRITVLRDGQRIATVDAAAVSEGELIELMTGRRVDLLFPEIAHAPGEALLAVRGLRLANGVLRGASIEVRAGEVTALAGLVGCGKSEIGRAVFGLEDIEAGEIVLRGRRIEAPTPSRLLDAGLVYFPSDRGAEGLALGRPIRENTTVSALHLPGLSRFRVIRRARERALAADIALELQLRPTNIERAVGELSGGNRQKVLLGRGLTRPFEVFVFDEPTVGIDVGAKREVYEVIKRLAERGAAVLLISSEMPEVLNMANRVFVIHHGEAVAELQGEQITEEAILACYFIDKRPAGGDGEPADQGDTQ